MLVDLILAGVAVFLAAGAFVLKRHAGTLILAVLAGAFLASVASSNIAGWLHTHGYELATVRTLPLVGITLTLAPAMLGWLAVPKSSGKRRIVGAVVFGAVGAAMVASFAGFLFAEELVSRAHYDEIAVQYRPAIIAVALVFALADLYLGKFASGHGAAHKKK